MSNWSSFEKDKIATDAWRSYLNERYRDEIAGSLGIPTKHHGAHDGLPAEEEEEEDGWDDDEETEEIERPEPEDEDAEPEEFSSDECKELFDINDPDIKNILDGAKADNTVRGKVAELGRDFSLTMDAAALTLAGAGVALGGVTLPGVAFSATASWFGSLVAVAFDIMNGEFKQAAIDAIGLLFVPGTSTGAKAVGKTVAVGAEKAAVKAAQKIGAETAEAALKTATKEAGEVATQTAAKAAGETAAKSAKAAISGIRNVGGQVGAKAVEMELRLATQLAATGLPQNVADAVAKGIITKSREKLQKKLKELVDGIPLRSEYDTDEQHKKALKTHYQNQKEQTAKIFKACFSQERTETQKKIIRFIDWLHDFVDEVPRWLSSAIGFVMGGGSDDEEVAQATPESPPATEEEVSALQQRYAAHNLEESEIKRWQDLAGIKKSVI